jgi:hypothetical protein
MMPEIFHWTIYDHPLDAPLGYVLRSWLIGRDRGIPNLISCGSTDLRLLRDTLPPGLYNLGRYAEDDPAILEVWI